jgi:hypothetical protein
MEEAGGNPALPTKAIGDQEVHTSIELPRQMKGREHTRTSRTGQYMRGGV